MDLFVGLEKKIAKLGILFTGCPKENQESISRFYEFNTLNFFASHYAFFDKNSFKSEGKNLY